MAAHAVTQSFEAGAGASSSVVYTLIAGSCYVAILLVVAWCFVSIYQGHTNGTLNFSQLLWTFVRGLVLVLVIGWLVLP
ncbi:TIGR03758 family integrating conjugative element protein [Carnimonas bestiolae]|uniref:TIGR03758 family integrating conjugative element protein n=1 Tax=Carnimonas bestiolae TaxID=3402172 RepID=UPI003EDC1ADD